LFLLLPVRKVLTNMFYRVPFKKDIIDYLGFLPKGSFPASRGRWLTSIVFKLARIGDIVIEKDAFFPTRNGSISLHKRRITTAKKFPSFTRRWNGKAYERERSFHRYYFSCLCNRSEPNRCLPRSVTWHRSHPL